MENRCHEGLCQNVSYATKGHFLKHYIRGCKREHARPLYCVANLHVRHVELKMAAQTQPFACPSVCQLLLLHWEGFLLRCVASFHLNLSLCLVLFDAEYLNISTVTVQYSRKILKKIMSLVCQRADKCAACSLYLSETCVKVPGCRSGHVSGWILQIYLLTMSSIFIKIWYLDVKLQ